MFSRTRFSLDGQWQFLPANSGFSGRALDFGKLGSPAASISVPAPWQADERFRSHTGAAWYQRHFDLPTTGWGAEQVIILGFNAVDYTARVWLNAEYMGEHEGGYLPFEFDITAAARPGENVLTVYVDDPLAIFAEIPHGKQSWYGQLSGIWQSVWIELRNRVHIRQVKITPQNEGIDVNLRLSGELTGPISVEVHSPAGQIVARLETCSPNFFLPVDHPLRWSPEEPNLYQLHLIHEQDEVSETFGFRTIETRDGKIFLNGRPFYLRAALDQDYYPDLICTPPSQEYIEDEFRQAKAMGLNCLRVHIKVADPRYYAAADKVGLLIWTELPNHMRLTQASMRRAKETLAGMLERDWNHPSIGIWTIINESWGIDLTDPAQRLWLAETYLWLKQMDPTRLVVGNSACWGNFHVVTDLADFHIYYAMPDHAQEWEDWVRSYARRPDWSYAHVYQEIADWRKFVLNPWNTAGRGVAPEVSRHGDEPLILSEFGNWGLPDIDSLVAANDNQEPWWFESGLEWGEGVVYPHGIEARFKAYHLDQVFPSLSALSQASQALQFAALKYEIEHIRQYESIQGYVITELTDVHWECNGLLDMNRKPKNYVHNLVWLNADNLLIPSWKQLAYSAGETCEMTILYSHYSAGLPEQAVLQWRAWTPDDGLEFAAGSSPTPPLKPLAVTDLGPVAVTCPAVDRPSQARLELRLVDKGCVLAYSEQDFYIFPAASALEIKPQTAQQRIYAPGFSAVLKKMDAVLVDDLFSADIAVVSVLDDACRRYLLGGGRVLFLAEQDDALQTHIPGIKILPRLDTPWQGDWASSFGWHRFASLPTNGVVNFAFVGLTPDHVISGFSAPDFAHDVFAGLFVGWLHKPIPVIARRPVGQGEVLISTLGLTQNLSTNPLAAFLFRELLALIS